MLRRLVLLSALVFLAACQPLALQPAQDNVSVSSAMDKNDPAPMLDVTPEPFAEPTAPLASSGVELDASESLAAGTLVIGDDSSPLSISVFLHPLSPYAREFQRLRMPTLIKEFVEPGLLTIQLVTLPINKYPGTEDVIRSVTCAGEQDKAYAAHARLFDKGTTTLEAEDIEDLSLDPTLFDTCVSTMTGDILAAPRALSEQRGVTLVPTYIIRSETFVGFPTEADLVGAIKAAL